MTLNNNNNNADEVSYDEPPPEGGFGYVVVVAVTVIAMNCSLPLAAFGIVYGNFLSNLGDETTGTSLANGIFNTVMSFTGLAANILLNQFSCRYVALLGAISCAIGCFSLILINDLYSFIVFFGAFQGFGYGLLLPASLTALNSFFNKKLSLMLSLSQAVMIGATMMVPPLATFAMQYYGYNGALVWMGCITLLNIPASLALSPIDWRRRTVLNGQSNLAFFVESQISVKSKSSNDLAIPPKYQHLPLLKKYSLQDPYPIKHSDLRVLSLADRTASVATFDGGHLKKYGEKESFWESLTNSVDFSLLQNVKYLNISLGLSLSYTSDICFITLIPLILNDNGFSTSDVALTMSVFFGSDLISRILLSIISAVGSINSRHLVLWGSLLSVVFRTAFVWYNSFLWKTVTLGALGFLRCFIQTPLPLVISEEYPNQFATAYSLYMVVCGMVTLVCGPLMSVVKSLTNSDVMVCHLLTGGYLLCVIAWVFEMLLSLRNKRSTKALEERKDAKAINNV